MAAVVGAVQTAWAFTEAVGPGLQVDSSADKVLYCLVSVIWNAGTYAQADDATFAPSTVIQNTRRNGKTVTVRQACFVSPGDENGTTVTADVATNTSGTFKCQLLGSDLTTEHANAAMSATWNRPVSFVVSFTESIA
jgi:hypothetical protein